MDILTIGQYTLTLHPVLVVALLVLIGMPVLLWIVLAIIGVVVARRERTAFQKHFDTPRFRRPW